jgi:threonine dehydratase
VNLQELEAAEKIVRTAMAPTPQHCWPQLCERLGAETWIKHENHGPTGAFKVRGGLVYFDALAREKNPPRGVVSATRGNHGQSVAFAARRHGIAATVVVPHGNSADKNAAVRALGATLVEHGDDFQAAREHAQVLADAQGLHMIPSFHPLLVAGVATWALELFRAVAEIDTLYVPIGLGSGICGAMAARDALGLSTKIVGVVSSGAPAYALSFAARQAISHPVTTQLADGMACRVPERAALELIWQGVERIVEVGEDDVAGAMRELYDCTHNVAEGAGAAALAAARIDSARNPGGRVAMVLSGGNVDRATLRDVLAG